MKNLQSKTRPINDPFEVYTDPRAPSWEWRVLKRYQSPENEAKNSYARAFCAVKSPFTHGGFDLGDTYLREIGSELVYRDPLVGDPVEGQTAPEAW